MKQKKSIPAMAGVVLSLLATIGVKTVFHACIHEDGSFGACHWAGEALFGISLLLALENAAVLLLGRKDQGVCKGLYLAILLTSVLGILIPGTLIDLCGMATMHCRAVMRPAMTIILALDAVAGAAGFIVANHG